MKLIVHSEEQERLCVHIKVTTWQRSSLSILGKSMALFDLWFCVLWRINTINM